MCTRSDFGGYRPQCGHLDYNPNKKACSNGENHFPKELVCDH